MSEYIDAMVWPFMIPNSIDGFCITLTAHPTLRELKIQAFRLNYSFVLAKVFTSILLNPFIKSKCIKTWLWCVFSMQISRSLTLLIFRCSGTEMNFEVVLFVGIF